MAEDVKNSVDDLDLSDFNFDDLPEVTADGTDLNLEDVGNTDFNFDDILAAEGKVGGNSSESIFNDDESSGLSFDDLSTDVALKDDGGLVDYEPVADENISAGDVLPEEEKVPEVSPFGEEMVSADAVSDDFTPEPDDFTPEPFGTAEPEIADENISVGDVLPEEEKVPEVSPFGEEMATGDTITDDFTPEPFGTAEPEIADENISVGDVLPEEEVPEVSPFENDNINNDEPLNDYSAEALIHEDAEIPEDNGVSDFAEEDTLIGETSAAQSDFGSYNEDTNDDADLYPPLDEYAEEPQIIETGNVANLRWFSGSENDEMYEIGRNFKSNTFEANDNCKTIHVNVGYDTYGWEVQFADGVIMNLRDVREYQIRNGKLPSPEGRIIYGPNTLMFSGVERIVIYETVRYFSYGV